MRMLGGAPRLKLAFEFIISNLLAALVGGFVAELCKEGAMPCTSCGRWSYDWIDWIHWNPDHGDDMIASLIRSPFHFFRS